MNMPITWPFRWPMQSLIQPMLAPKNLNEHRCHHKSRILYVFSKDPRHQGVDRTQVALVGPRLQVVAGLEFPPILNKRSSFERSSVAKQSCIFGDKAPSLRCRNAAASAPVQRQGPKAPTRSTRRDPPAPVPSSRWASSKQSLATASATGSKVNYDVLPNSRPSIPIRSESNQAPALPLTRFGSCLLGHGRLLRPRLKADALVISSVASRVAIPHGA